MSTYNRYQSNKRKGNSRSTNSFEKGVNPSLSDEIIGERKERLKDWVTFYRKNIHRFVEHYMGVKLYPYQRYWIYLISQSTHFLGYASRASAKSWLIAVYGIARCILYPHTIVSLNSSTKGQAGLIISEKVKSLFDEHPNIAREISNITTNANKWQVDFHNGSKINVVISGEGGRGHRSNISVLEERRLIPTQVIDSIIRPFLVSRSAPFMKLPEYQGVFEEPQEVIISSVHYKATDWYPEAKKLLLLIANGDPDVKAVFFDFLITLRHGIKTKKQMVKEQEKLDQITFSMEYGNIPFGGSSSAYFQVDFFNRKIKRAWIPRPVGFDGIGKNNYSIPRKMGERRVVSVDVATRAGSKNDNTIITCARLFPTKKGWRTDVVYMESHNGSNTLSQVLRIKQIYSEFTGFNKDDFLVLDVANAGISIYDSLTTVTPDEEMDVEYDAMQVMEHPSISDDAMKDLSERCLTPDAHRCIYPITAGAKLNSLMATAMRTRLKDGLVNFLVDENQQEEFFIKKKNKDIIGSGSSVTKARILSPNVQTTLFINECISLVMTITDGSLIKLKEQAGSRKDRYSSVSYLNYVVSLFDMELLKSDGDEDDFGVWEGAFGIT